MVLPDLFDQFVDVLSTVDCLILLDVYSAGEDVIVGATGLDLYKSISRKSNVLIEFVEDINSVPKVIDALVTANDFVLTQGAGETGKLAQSLREHWRARRLES